MKVHELKELLDTFPQGAEIYLSSDAEGNSYARLDEPDLAYVRKSNVAYGRTDYVFGETDITDLAEEDELTADEIREDLEQVVALWPV